MAATRRVVPALSLALVPVLSAWAPGAEAAGRRARLSDDLTLKLQAGDLSGTDVIVGGTPARVDAIAARHGLVVKRRLRTGAVLAVPAGRLEAVAADEEVDALSGDHDVRSSMAVTNVAIGADQVWAGIDGHRGVTGEGVGVAIVDSGIANHPALRGRVVASVDFTAGREAVASAAIDHYGHGTHVAGIVAAAGGTAEETGVAPGAHLVNLKVLGADGSGKASAVVAAIDWAVDHKDRYRLRVINLSLGHPVMQSYKDDPLGQAVERAYRAGLVVVASAGNLGKTRDGRPVLGGITSPGNSPFAIAVGAVNTKGTAYRSDDVMATYSSKGPTRFDRLIKPDLAAPGNRIRGLLAPGAALAREHPELVVGSGKDAQLELSGTSMAAAVVSGAAALIVEDQPAKSVFSLRRDVQHTAQAITSASIISSGAGSLNIVVALSGTR